MKDWNSVDKKWREQLQNKSDNIPEGLWSRIEERLEEKPVRRFPIYWAAAAMVLIAFGISWNWLPEEETPATTKVASSEPIPLEKPVSRILVESTETVAVSPISILKSTAKSEEQEPAVTSEPEIVPDGLNKEKVAVVEPVIEMKSETEEVVTVRLDINPVMEEERQMSKRRKKSLFGKIIGELRQALDGEPVNWQKLKEGNPAFENNIHNVANTYVKTEENFKRTLQIQ